MKPGTMSDAIKKGREYGGFAWQFAPAGEAASIEDSGAAAPAAAPAAVPAVPAAASAAAPAGDAVPQPSVADASAAEAGEGANALSVDDEGVGAVRTEETADETTTTAPTGIAAGSQSREAKPMRQIEIGTRRVLQTLPLVTAAAKGLGGLAWRKIKPGKAASIAIEDSSSAAPAAAPAVDAAPRSSATDGSAAEAGEEVHAPSGDDGAEAVHMEATADEAAASAPQGQRQASRTAHG